MQMHLTSDNVRSKCSAAHRSQRYPLPLSLNYNLPPSFLTNLSMHLKVHDDQLVCQLTTAILKGVLHQIYEEASKEEDEGAISHVIVSQVQQPLGGNDSTWCQFRLVLPDIHSQSIIFPANHLAANYHKYSKSDEVIVHTRGSTRVSAHCAGTPPFVAKFSSSTTNDTYAIHMYV